MGVTMAPVEGSGTWPAWMQMVLNRARSESFTVVEAYSDTIRTRNEPLGVSQARVQQVPSRPATA